MNDIEKSSLRICFNRNLHSLVTFTHIGDSIDLCIPHLTKIKPACYLNIVYRKKSFAYNGHL